MKEERHDCNVRKKTIQMQKKRGRCREMHMFLYQWMKGPTMHLPFPWVAVRLCVNGERVVKWGCGMILPRLRAILSSCDPFCFIPE